MNRTKEYLRDCLNNFIPSEWGTCNLICPKCFYRSGHPIIYCSKCGEKYVKFNDTFSKITNLNWIFSALSKDEQISRAGIVMCKYRITFGDEQNKIEWKVQEEYFLEYAKKLK